MDRLLLSTTSHITFSLLINDLHRNVFFHNIPIMRLHQIFTAKDFELVNQTRSSVTLTGM